MGLFGNKKKIQELETQIQLLQTDLNVVNAQKEKALSEARKYKQKCESIEQELQIQLASVKKELAQVHQQQKSVKSENQEYKQNAERLENEYLSLKNIYQQKIQDFEENVDEQTRQLVHEAEVARRDLADELKAEKQKSFEDLSQTIATFSAEYRHYLNQVILMAEALNTAAINTVSKVLPDINNVDVSACFSQEMYQALDREGLSVEALEETLPSESGLEKSVEELAAQISEINGLMGEEPLMKDSMEK